MPNKVYRYKMKTLYFTILTITYPTHLTRKMPREPGGERRRNQLDSSALEIKPKKTWRIKIVHHLNRILSEVKKKSRMRNLYFLQEMLPNVFATQLSWNEIPTNYIHGVASAQWGNTGGSRSCLVTCSLLLSSRIKNEEKTMLSGLSPKSIFSRIDDIPVSYTLKMHVPGWGILGHHCSLGTSSSIFQWEIERFFTFNLLYYSLDLLVYLPTMIIITFSFFFQLFCLLFIFVGCNCNEPSWEWNVSEWSLH